MLKVRSAVGSVKGSKVYTVSDGISQDYYLIDIGDFAAAQQLLPNDARVRGVFLTHGHHDHIMGINDLKAAYPKCVVYASEECQTMLTSSKANLSYYVETSIEIEYKGEVCILHDGDSIELFKDIHLNVIATPGHHSSCLSYLGGDYLFTGDSYIPGVKVVTNLPKGNKKQAEESVARILELGRDRMICGGH